MSTGHDTKCTNCKGSGERIIREFIKQDPVQPLEDLDLGDPKIVCSGLFATKIVECPMCSGTGLIERDDHWEHA